MPGQPPATPAFWRLSAAFELNHLLVRAWDGDEPPWVRLTESLREVLDADAVEVLRPSLDTPIRDEILLGRTMAVPLLGERGSHGVVEIRRRNDQPAFSAEDLALASSLGQEITLTLELDGAQTSRQRSRLLDERDRTARRVQAQVVHRLSAAGLLMPGATPAKEDQADRVRLTEVIGALDHTMREIATAIPTAVALPTLRRAVAEVADSVGSAFGLRPWLCFRGPVDLLDDPVLVQDVAAAVRDGLTNAGRHAALSHVQVRLTSTEDQLQLIIEDDARSLGGHLRHEGTATLRNRAERRGGTLVVDRSPLGGVRLVWGVPLP